MSLIMTDICTYYSLLVTKYDRRVYYRTRHVATPGDQNPHIYQTRGLQKCSRLTSKQLNQ